MKICICGGTNPATNPKYYAVAAEMGELLVENDFEMVWGGNAFGMLSHVHKKYLEKRADNTLVLPKAYKDDLKEIDMSGTKVFQTKQVSARTVAMFMLSNAAVFIPGGIGTIYEFWSAVEYRRAGEFNIEIILLNFDNFYRHQLAHFDFINKNGFTKTGEGGAPYKLRPEELFHVAETPQQVIEILQGIQERQKTKQ